MERRHTGSMPTAGATAPTLGDESLQASLGIDIAPRHERLSRTTCRLLDTADAIYGNDVDDVAFIHSILAMCGLPYRRPPPDVREFERRNGRASLLITAGKLADPKTGDWKEQGIPYGPRARLLLIHFCSEALRNRSPEVEIGDSMTAFMRSLGIEPTGGKNGSIPSFKEQVNRLAAARMQIGYWGETGTRTMEAKPIKSINVWFPEDPKQKILWSSTIVLDPVFFDSLQRFAVPLDHRAIEALKHNALALDLYAWLAHRLHRVKSPDGDFVPWTSLYQQFGEGYARMVDFRRKFLQALRQATTVYFRAKIEETGKGLKLHQSPPPVAKRLIVVGGIGK